jgi:major type 1 subunit fimbrin (pilin)
MKKLHILGLAISAALCIPMAAQASDGAITFTGELTDQTCTVNGGAGKDFNVALPKISTTLLKVLGDTAGATNFAINVTQCSASILGYTAYFEASQNINVVDGKLVNTKPSGALNVEIELLNQANTSVINLSKASTFQGVTAGTFTAGTVTPATFGVGTSNFIARYYATGVTTAGLVTSSITYSLVYN